MNQITIILIISIISIISISLIIIIFLIKQKDNSTPTSNLPVVPIPTEIPAPIPTEIPTEIPTPIPAPILVSSKCANYTDSSNGISTDCMSELWKKSGCTTDITFSSKGSEYWKTLSLHNIKKDMLGWSNNKDATSRNGCYNIPIKTSSDAASNAAVILQMNSAQFTIPVNTYKPTGPIIPIKTSPEIDANVAAILAMNSASATIPINTYH